MIEYVIENNPDDRILKKAIEFLVEGELVALPTDTNWIIAANPYSKKSVETLYKIKHASKEKHFSLLCNSVSQASQFAVISDMAYKFLRKKIPGPFTFIFMPTKDIPRCIKDYKKEKEIGIRIPKSVLCSKLISLFEKPLIITSITHSMLNDLISSVDQLIDIESSICSYQIEEALGHRLSMIIDGGVEEFLGDSTIVNFSNNDGVPEVIRHGAGDISELL